MTAPGRIPATQAAAFSVPAALEAEMDEIIARYPQKRSASLMLMHAMQERFGHISAPAAEWIARKLELQPIHILELLTFYPMFRRAPAGRFQLKICRTLSCALGGSGALHEHVCRKLGLDAAKHGLQTTRDGAFSLEFVECLAGCGTAPVMMCNEDFFEGVSASRATEIVEQCAAKLKGEQSA